MEPQQLQALAQTLEERIGDALAQSDWLSAAEIATGLDAEYSNRGMTIMLGTFLEVMQPRFDVDNAAFAARIRDAIETRDASLVRSLLAAKSEYHRLFHQLYVDTMASIMSLIAKQSGADALEETLREIGEKSKEAMFAPVFNAPVETQVEAYAFAFRGHMGAFSVSEDEEKFSFVHDPCGSGGRIMRSGAYEGENGLARVSAGGMTLEREDFPVYCTHCPVWLGQQHQEWFGSPQWVLEPPGTNQSPCRLHIYKNHADIPEDYRATLRRGRSTLITEEGSEGR